MDFVRVADDYRFFNFFNQFFCPLVFKRTVGVFFIHAAALEVGAAGAAATAARKVRATKTASWLS